MNQFVNIVAVNIVAEPLSFSCKPLDALCLVQEGFTNQLAGLLTQLSNSFLSGFDFNPASSLWSVAEGQASFWFGYVVMIMLIAAVVGIVTSLIRGDSHALRRVLIGTVLSVPVSLFAIFVVGQALEVTDALSAGILEGFGGEDGFTHFTTSLITGEGIALASGSGQAVIVLVLLLCVVALFIVMLSLAFRTFALLLLVSFAPLAFMILPASGGGIWVRRWVSAVVAMVIAKPVMFGSIKLLLAACGEVRPGLSAMTITLIVGLFVVGFMPMMLYGFFQFLGSEAAGSHIGSAVASRASHVSARGSAMASRGLSAVGSAGRAGAAGRAGSSGAAGKSPVPPTSGASKAPSTPPSPPSTPSR